MTRNERRGAHYLKYLADLGTTGLHPLGGAATKALLSVLAARPGERILEVGCGTGETLVRVTLVKDIDVVGIDELRSMLRVARRRLALTGSRARAKLIQASGTALPVTDRSYDAVYTESVLGFQNEVAARAMLREIARILKPSGRYVANEAIWKEGTDPAMAAAIHASALADFGLSQASRQFWTLDDWVDEMEGAGLRLESANLLREWINLADLPQGTRRPWQLQVSQMLSSFYRVRAFIMPRLLRETYRYWRRLRRHREDGFHVETRLFVLTRL